MPASLNSLKHDDSHRRLQMLQRARGNFREDDSQEEEKEGEEEGRGEPLMTGLLPMAMYAGSPPSDLDVGRRVRRGGATMPDVLSDECRSSISISSNPLPDLLPPQATLSAALDCPDSSCSSVLYHQTNSIGQNSDACPENGWVGIGQGLNRLAGMTTAEKGFLEQRRKSCLGSKLMTGEVSSSRKKKMTRRRSVGGTGWMENTRGMRSEQGGIFRDICAIVSIFGFYICVRKIESLLK